MPIARHSLLALAVLALLAALLMVRAWWSSEVRVGIAVEYIEPVDAVWIENTQNIDALRKTCIAVGKVTNDSARGAYERDMQFAKATRGFFRFALVFCVISSIALALAWFGWGRTIRKLNAVDLAKSHQPAA